MARESNDRPPVGGPSGTPPEASSPADATGSIHLPRASTPGTGDSTGLGSFDIGDLVATRYRIKRFLGRGGMGEVFEVEDLILGTSVALKTIRPREADRTEAVERFKREINVARKVTHPNVCRIFDVGIHQTLGTDGKTRETLFLTMELLPGDNLSDRVDKGRFSSAEAMTVVEDMAAGLGAAHRAGIIHRDFKSANVMLVPSKESGRTVRAVITDFGLARTLEPEAGQESLSESGIVVGTPAYMSPEQVRGEPLTPVSDIYALGLVIFEMMTGQRPFSGGSAWSVAVRRLTQEPPSPRSVVPDLSERWDAAIRACLQIDPALRPQTPEAVVELIRKGPPSGETRAIPSVSRPTTTRGSSPRHFLGIGIGVLAVVGMGIFLWTSGKESAPAGPSGSTTSEIAPVVVARPSVLILGLTNVSRATALDWLPVAGAEIVNAQLSANEEIRVLPLSEGLRAARDLSWSGGLPAASEVAKIRGLLGVDYIVVGSVGVVGAINDGMVTVDLSLIDARTGETKEKTTATGSDASLTPLVSRFAEAAQKNLALKKASSESLRQAEGAWPTSREASRATAQGHLFLRLGNFVEARKSFEKAISLDDLNPAPRLGLVAALAAVGHYERARQEGEAIQNAAAGLSTQTRLLSIAQLNEATRNWPAAAKELQTLFALHPDDLDVGLRLAEAQTTMVKPKEALETVEALRRLPAPMSADPRIDLAAAFASRGLGNRKEQLEFASRASTAALKRGATSVAAVSRLLESSAHEALGDRKTAGVTAEEAQRLFETVSDRGGAARAIERKAAISQGTGNLDEARRLFERALSVHESLQDRASMARVLSSLGNLAYRQGDLGGAEKLDRDAIQRYREMGLSRQVAQVLNNLAMRRLGIGDLAGAQARYKEALEAFAAQGDRGNEAKVKGNLGEVALVRGELEAAESLLNEALAVFRELGAGSDAGYIQLRLADLALVRGDLVVAQERFQAALTAFEGLGEKLDVANTRSGMARLALANGKPEDAAVLAGQAEEVLRSEKSKDPQVHAALIKAEALMAQGRLTEAQGIEKTVEPMAAETEDLSVKFAAGLLRAQLLARSGQPAPALQALEVTRKRAAGGPFAEYEFRARLIAGDIEMTMGRAAAGRARLQGLMKDATAKGFGLIARQAQQLASR